MIPEELHKHSGHEALMSGGANACTICQAFEIMGLKQQVEKLQEDLGNQNRVAADYKKAYELEFESHKAQTEKMIELNEALATALALNKSLQSQLAEGESELGL